MIPTQSQAQTPLTLTFDIGGSHLKAGILSPAGVMLKGPNKVNTPRPTKPEDVVEALVQLAAALGPHDRITIGFPGVVRADYVVTAPNLAPSYGMASSSPRSSTNGSRSRCAC